MHAYPDRSPLAVSPLERPAESVAVPLPQRVAAALDSSGGRLAMQDEQTRHTRKEVARSARLVRLP